MSLTTLRRSTLALAIGGLFVLFTTSLTQGQVITNGDFSLGGNQWSVSVPSTLDPWQVSFPALGGNPNGYARIQSPFADSTNGVATAVGHVSQVLDCPAGGAETCRIRFDYKLDWFDAPAGYDTARVVAFVNGIKVFVSQDNLTEDNPGTPWTTVNIETPPCDGSSPLTLALGLEVDLGDNAWIASFDNVGAECDENETGGSDGTQSQYTRGDGNADGSVNIADPSFVANYVFGIGNAPAPPCLAAADANGDNRINIADPSYLANFIFGIAGAQPPPAPSGACGVGAEDVLSCDVYESCRPVVVEEEGKPETKVVHSDNKMFIATATFPRVNFGEEFLGEEVFLRLKVPGLNPDASEMGSGEPGMPAVPMYHQLIALPEGSEAFVELGDVQSYFLEDVLLYPQQSTPGEEGAGGGAGVSFSYNSEVYETNAFFPPEVAQIQYLGKMRDLNIALVSIASAQYNPAKKMLQVHEAVDVGVQFRGGEGFFLTEDSFNPFEQSGFDPVANEGFANADAFDKYVGGVTRDVLCPGEELVIITSRCFEDDVCDDDATCRFEQWKEQGLGIPTTVFYTDPKCRGTDDIDDVGNEANIGSDANTIRNFLRNRYRFCQTRPVYVLILGDVEHVPTFYRKDEARDIYVGTDAPYSFISGQDAIPDLYVSRISVDTKTAAKKVLEKIQKYEEFPPTQNPSGYRAATFVSYFQCCSGSIGDPQGMDTNTYLQTTESIIPAVTQDNHFVRRLYYADTDETGYGGNTVPVYFRDGSLLPPAIAPGSGFVWNPPLSWINDMLGKTSIMVHRAPGDSGGWEKPEYDRFDYVPMATGNLRPLLISADSGGGGSDGNTGKFDTESDDTTATDLHFIGAPPSQEGTGLFIEGLVKHQVGVIGALASTRRSTRTVDDALTRGFMDAIFPDLESGFGVSTSIRRLGEILVHGKLYMYTQVGVTQPNLLDFSSDTAMTHNWRWHAFGDPTQHLWLGDAKFLLAEAFLALNEAVSSLSIRYGEINAQISVLQDGLPLGRIRMTSGEAEIHFIAKIDPSKEIYVVANRINSIAVTWTLPPLIPPGPQCDDLDQEEMFSAAATRITFDESEGRSVEEFVEDQYETLGVQFERDATKAPLIVDDGIRGASTNTPEYSLFNNTVWPNTSSGVPMGMRFSQPVQRVGMYVGNGNATGGVHATLTGYDAAGTAICTVNRQNIPDDVTAFLGMDVGSALIVRVELDYGAVLNGEEIDTLFFE